MRHLSLCRQSLLHRHPKEYPLPILLALACDILLPDSAQHPAAEHPYFTWALLIGLAVYVIALLISLGNTKVRDKLSYSALFYAGAVLVLNILISRTD